MALTYSLILAPPIVSRDCYVKKGLPSAMRTMMYCLGLVTTATRLENRDILIGDCPMLKEELDTYAWDKKATDRGEDAPIKMDDHGCDALRYYAHSTGKLYRGTGNMKVTEALTWH